MSKEDFDLKEVLKEDLNREEITKLFSDCIESIKNINNLTILLSNIMNRSIDINEDNNYIYIITCIKNILLYYLDTNKDIFNKSNEKLYKWLKDDILMSFITFLKEQYINYIDYNMIKISSINILLDLAIVYNQDYRIKYIYNIIDLLYKHINDQIYHNYIFKYDDLLYLTLNYICNIMNKENYLIIYNNFIKLLNPLLKNILKRKNILYYNDNDDNLGKKYNRNTIKMILNSLYIQLLSDFNDDLYLIKDLLLIMDEILIPYVIIKPLSLADFLTNSYNLINISSNNLIISLLSLNSLYILITKYNLDYPNFYIKLYNILKIELFHLKNLNYNLLLKNKELFHSKYRAKFYILLYLFLSSTHLPSYLIASFIKKLSMLSLYTSPDATLFILVLNYNLLLKNKACQILLHNPNMIFNNSTLSQDQQQQQQEESEDINLININILKQADQYSLWEIKTLCQHYNPQIAKIAQVYFDTKSIPKAFNIIDYIDYSYTSYFIHSLNKPNKQNIQDLIINDQSIFNVNQQDNLDHRSLFLNNFTF